MTPSHLRSLAERVSGATGADRPIWSVAIDGFSECYVEADTKASARWCVASACHAAGYGRSPVELISRGCSVHPSSRLEADLFASTTLVAPKRARATLADQERPR